MHSSLDPVLRTAFFRPTQAAPCSRESASGSRNGVANLNPKLDSDPTHTPRVLWSCSCYSLHQRTESQLIHNCIQIDLSDIPTARFLGPRAFVFKEPDTVTVSWSPSPPAHTRTGIAELFQISYISMTRGGGTGRGYSAW